MRSKFFVTVICIIMLIIGTLIWGQAAEQPREADHNELRALSARITEAMNRHDVKALEDCLAKEFVFTGVDQTVVTDGKQLQDYFNKTFSENGGILKAVIVNPKATILTNFLSDDIGYCYGISDCKYVLKNGKSQNMQSKWTALLVKEDGQWKIKAFHSGADILKNPLLDKAKSLLLKSTIGGVLGGMLLGIFVGFVIFRQKK